VLMWRSAVELRSAIDVLLRNSGVELRAAIALLRRGPGVEMLRTGVAVLLRRRVLLRHRALRRCVLLRSALGGFGVLAMIVALRLGTSGREERTQHRPGGSEKQGAGTSRRMSLNHGYSHLTL